MLKKITSSVFIAIVTLSMAHGADKLPRSYKSSLYSCSLGNRYYGAGASFIKFKGHHFGSFCGGYVSLKDADKRVDYREKLLRNATDIKVSEDGKVVSFATKNPIKKRKNKNTGEKVYAEIERQFKLTDDSIEVKAKFIAKEDIVLAKSWLLSELLNLTVKSIIGANVEAKTYGRNPETITALVPKVFSKKKWNMRGAFSSIKFIMNDREFQINAGENSLLTIGHYGGANIEISAKPVIKHQAVKYAKGSVVSWSYSVKFAEIK